MQVTRHSLYQQAKERECQIIAFAIPGDQNISFKQQKKIDKCHQITEKNWQVPGLNNRVTECFEYQGSGHISSYRCFPNYVEENTSV